MAQSTFTLEFLGECPYEVGQEVESPATGGLGGSRVQFAGRAFVQKIHMADYGDGAPAFAVTFAHYFDPPWETAGRTWISTWPIDLGEIAA